MNKSYTLMELEAIKKICKSVNLIANLPADLIADTNVATNTTYSSYRIDAEMSALENDIQRYVDTALAGLSRLTKEVIDDKALVVKENVLYLYKDPTDMNNDYMQMMLINGVAVELGTTTCDFSSVYSKDEIDDKFALKIDLDVLTTSFNNLVTTVDKKIEKDNIVTVLDDTVTDEQVPSAKTMVEELDLKANDDEVVKKTDITDTIDINSSDMKIPNVKAIYDDIIEGRAIDQTVIDTYGTEILKYPLGIWRISNDSTSNKFTDLPVKTSGRMEITSINSDINKTPWNNDWGYRTYNFETYKGMNYFRKVSSGGTAGVLRYDTGWQRVCGTTIDDVSKTTLTPVFPSGVVVASGGVAINYIVRNGWCNVNFVFNITSATTFSWTDIASGLPIPANSANIVLMSEGGKATQPIAIKINSTGAIASRVPSAISTADWWTGNISYPVKE